MKKIMSLMALLSGLCMAELCAQKSTDPFAEISQQQHNPLASLMSKYDASLANQNVVMSAFWLTSLLKNMPRIKPAECNLLIGKLAKMILEKDEVDVAELAVIHDMILQPGSLCLSADDPLLQWFIESDERKLDALQKKIVEKYNLDPELLPQSR